MDDTQRLRQERDFLLTVLESMHGDIQHSLDFGLTTLSANAWVQRVHNDLREFQQFKAELHKHQREAEVIKPKIASIGIGTKVKVTAAGLGDSHPEYASLLQLTGTVVALLPNSLDEAHVHYPGVGTFLFPVAELIAQPSEFPAWNARAI